MAGLIPMLREELKQRFNLPSVSPSISGIPQVPLNPYVGDSSFGATPENEGSNVGWSSMSPAEQAAYYAENPTMASIAQAAQGLLGMTTVGQLAQHFAPQSWANQTMISHGIDPGSVSSGSIMGTGFAGQGLDAGYLDSVSGAESDPSTSVSGANSEASHAADGNDSGGGGGGGKIICTAMNHAYGFGSFRNAIWIAYADKHLTKAHEVGYHTLFLPLVDFGFKRGDGKLNLLVRKVLEWGTRHRSTDLRAEMRGTKRDLTGRIIRFIFEPLCYVVGKAKGH